MGILSLILLIIAVDIVLDYFIITWIVYQAGQRGYLELDGIEVDEGYGRFLCDFNRTVVESLSATVRRKFARR